MKSLYYDPNLPEGDHRCKGFKSIKLKGEADQGTSIYIEDYAYTYLQQYAKSDLSCELSAALVGEYFEDSSKIVIYGVLPIKQDLLVDPTKWIDQDVLEVVDEEKRRYFPEAEYVGWMHTQPGYGIMETRRELIAHKEVFGTQGVLMLLDSVFKEEAFFTCENDTLMERPGFWIYYEKNELMQKYMEDHTVVTKEDKKESNQVVDDFRALGTKRKREIEKSIKRSRIVRIALMGTLLMSVLMAGLYTQQKKINKLEEEIKNAQVQKCAQKVDQLESPGEAVFTSFQISSEPKYLTHGVEMGDSLLSISYDYYETISMVGEIAELNSIIDCDTIYIGQELKLPKR